MITFCTSPLRQPKEKNYRFNQMKRDIYNALQDKHTRYVFLKIELDQAGDNVKKLSETLGMSRNTVKEARKYIPDQNRESPQLGRPAKLNSAAKLSITSITYADPEKTALDIIQVLSQPPFNIDICENTDTNWGHKCEFKYVPRIREVIKLLIRFLKCWHLLKTIFQIIQTGDELFSPMRAGSRSSKPNNISGGAMVIIVPKSRKPTLLTLQKFSFGEQLDIISGRN